MNVERKKQLEDTINFAVELEKLHSVEPDLNALAKVSHFIRWHHETALPKLEKKFNQVFHTYFQRKKNSNRNEHFLKIAQTLAVACQCKRGQIFLIKTIRRALVQNDFKRFANNLVSHGLHRTLEIEKPISTLVKFVGNLYKDSYDQIHLKEEAKDNYQNAYLTYADMASRLPKT
jgi:hypothetical protein